MNSPIIFNTNQLVILNTLYQKYLENAFVATNTASGTTSATLNTRSGIVTFTADVENSSEATYFTLNNSLVTPQTRISYDLYYAPNDIDTCFISSYYSGNGVITFVMSNFSSQTASQGKIITFQLLN